jgi:hypothetical protein
MNDDRLELQAAAILRLRGQVEVLLAACKHVLFAMGETLRTSDDKENRKTHEIIVAAIATAQPPKLHP